MGIFIPEGNSRQTGVSQITPASPTVTDEDLALMERVFNAAASRPNAIPETFMAYLVDFIQTNNLSIPIGRVQGFVQYTAQVAPTISTLETRTSSTFGDLSTVGPTLSGLPDGNYWIAYGAGAAGNPAVSAAEMSIQVNSTTAVAADAAYTSVASSTSVMRLVSKTLSNSGSNTVTAKYASTDNTFACSWQDRWMIALRFSN